MWESAAVAQASASCKSYTHHNFNAHSNTQILTQYYKNVPVTILALKKPTLCCKSIEVTTFKLTPETKWKVGAWCPMGCGTCKIHTSPSLHPLMKCSILFNIPIGRIICCKTSLDKFIKASPSMQLPFKKDTLIIINFKWVKGTYWQEHCRTHQVC